MALTPHDLLDTEELAALLGVRPSSLAQMRTRPDRHRSIDDMPEPLRLVSKRPVWSRAAVEAWMASRPPQRYREANAAKPAAQPKPPKVVEPVEATPATDEVPWVPWPSEATRPV